MTPRLFVAATLIAAVFLPRPAVAQGTAQSTDVTRSCCTEELVKTGALLAGVLFIRQELVTQPAGAQPKWSAPTGVDRWVRTKLLFGEHEHVVDTISDVTYGLTVATGVLGAMALQDDDDRIPALRRVIAAWAVTNVVTGAGKRTLARARPGWHFENSSAEISGDDAFTSMPSGHASGSFALVMAAISLCEMDGCAAGRALKVVGLPAATATALLRISADKHYVTDVIVGATLGSAIGWYLPRVMRLTRADQSLQLAPVVTRSERAIHGIVVW